MNKKSVLFVDDEINILNSIQRNLRPLSHKYQVDYFTTVAEALERLKIQNYDFIISDYKMPGMDGFEFLTQAMALQPQAKRVLLTGQADKKVYETSQKIVHIYLSKPCEIEKLITILDFT